MKWEIIKDIDQLNEIDELSKTQPVLIFKHSTRCSISNAALSRFERDWKEEDAGSLRVYYLDLLAYRPISNAIAERYGVEHQSPQILLINHGKCIYNDSHTNIRLTDIRPLV